MCLVLTPLMLEIVLALDRNPVPYLLAVALASTLARNLTVLGSVANLIVIQKARRYASISFWEYFKVGLPLTVVTIAIGIFLLR